MTSELSARTVVVTGAASGIGRAIADGWLRAAPTCSRSISNLTSMGPVSRWLPT
jgi:NAD(P)-dependent dehydrogenase (short-subunit alcohol dehydrogenase family)